MKRTSVIAAFALLAAILVVFAACGKKNKAEGPTNPTFVDENGQVYEEITEIASEVVTQTVPVTDENGETETVTVVRTVPVTKAGGEKVTKADGKQETVTEIVTEVKTEVVSEVVTEIVTITQPVTTTEKATEGKKDSGDETTQGATDPVFDNPFPAGKVVEVETDANGNPKNSKTDRIMSAVKSSKQFQIDCVAVTTEVIGMETGVPFKLYYKGNNMAYDVSVGAMKCRMIVKDGKATMLFPSAKAYYTMSGDQVGASDLSEMDLADALTNEGLEYVKTSDVTVKGTTYTCEEYKNSDEGITMKYYFIKNALKRIEILDSGASEPAILKVNSFSTAVDDKEFDVPKGYTQLSDDKFEALLGTFQP